MVTRGTFPGLLREVGEDAWPWLVGGGVTLVLLGAIGLGAAVLATIVTVVAFGLILLAGGIVQVLVQNGEIVLKIEPVATPRITAKKPPLLTAE